MWYKKGFFSFGGWGKGNSVRARKKTYTEKVMIINLQNNRVMNRSLIKTIFTEKNRKKKARI